MLTISGNGCSRRDFLRVGGLGLAGLSLPELAALRAAEGGQIVKDRSVVFVMMHGGPSQIETFDPKMTAPDGIRSCLGETQTKHAGITFGGPFPRLAALADKLAIVRSYVPENASHLNPRPLVDRNQLNATLGSIYARVAGMNNPRSGVPNNVALFTNAVDPQAEPPREGNQGGLLYVSPGGLGSAYAPFDPAGGGETLANLRLQFSAEQLHDRQSLLRQLDSLRRDIDATGTMYAMDRFQEQAVDVLLRGVAAAFDLSKEDPRTLARYDTAPLARKASANLKHQKESASALGKQLLLARRLCEAGCGFVTVFSSHHIWDMHGGVMGPTRGILEAMPLVGGSFDHAIAAFIEDVEARGQRDNILLVCTGEMGRTPRISTKTGGRDHWANLAPLLIHGGGLKMGQVIGRSTADAGRPADDPIYVRDLVATIFHTLFDLGELRLDTALSKVVNVLSKGEPIRQLLG